MSSASTDVGHATSSVALRRILSELVALLDSVSERNWSDQIRRALEAGPNEGSIMSWFGGMGSLSDLLILPENGHQLRAEDTQAVQEKLDALRSELYELARARQRELA